MTRIPLQVTEDLAEARSRLARREKLTWEQFCALVYDETNLPTWWHVDGRPDRCVLRDGRVGYIESAGKIAWAGGRWERASGGRMAHWASLLEDDRCRESALAACKALIRRDVERPTRVAREERQGEMAQAVVGVDVEGWVEEAA